MKIFVFKNGKPAGRPGSGRTSAAPSALPTARPAPTSEAERKEQSAGPAKDLAKPANKNKLPEIVTKMPEGKFKEFAKAAVDIGKQYGMSKNAPMIKFLITLCVFMGKYAHLIDRIPGNYRKSLDEGDLAKEKFSVKQRERFEKRVPKDYKDFHALLDLHKSKTKLDASMTSTLFVSYMLFGSGEDVNHLTNHKILAARLAHESGYKDSTLLSLKRQKIIPKGTVIFFSKNLKSGVIAAYATGNRQEFKYFVPGSKEPKTFKLDSTDSPIKSALNLLAAFVPNTLTEKKSPELAQEELAVAELEKKAKAQMKNKNITEKYENLAKTLSPDLQRFSRKINKGPEYKELAKKYIEIINSVLKELEKDIKKMEDSKEPASPRLRVLIEKFRAYIQTAKQ
jgi:archaellum component FlaC